MPPLIQLARGGAKLHKWRISTNVVRKQLLSAALGERTIDRIDVRQIDLAPGQATGLHLHRGPVAGYVLRGRIHFQLEGQPETLLGPGDAFLEPAGARVARFDAAAQGDGARFIAFYLLTGENELITLLDR